MKPKEIKTWSAICHAVGIQTEEEIERLLQIEADIEGFTFSSKDVKEIEVRI